MRSANPYTVWTLRIALLGLVVGAWFYAQGPGEVSNVILPETGDLRRAIWSQLSSGELWAALGRTLTEAVIAGVIATGLGMLVGFMAARSEFRSRVVEPILVWGFMAPLILFYPLFLLWFGVGLWSKVGYAAASAFFPIAYNALRAFQTVDPRYVRVADAFGASRTQADLLVKLPAGIPLLASGIRVGLGVTLITVIVSEMIASTSGLGYEISQAAQTFNPAVEYAVILIVMVLACILQACLNTVFGQRKDALTPR